MTLPTEISLPNQKLFSASVNATLFSETNAARNLASATVSTAGNKVRVQLGASAGLSGPGEGQEVLVVVVEYGQGPEGEGGRRE